MMNNKPNILVEVAFSMDKDKDELFWKIANECIKKNVGDIYLTIYDRLVKQGNFDEAINYLEIGAENENPLCMFELGRLLVSGEEIGKNPRKGEELLHKSLNGGIKRSAYMLGLGYEDGLFGQKDLEKAMLYYKKGIELNDGSGDSEYHLARLYFKKRNENKENIKETIKYLKLACKHKNSHAYYRLGKMYVEGHYVKKNIKKGLELLYFSADQQNEYAITFLADHFSTNFQNNAYEAVGLYYLDKGKELQIPTCIFIKAVLLANGEHYKRNIDEAKTLFKEFVELIDFDNKTNVKSYLSNRKNIIDNEFLDYCDDFINPYVCKHNLNEERLNNN